MNEQKPVHQNVQSRIEKVFPKGRASLIIPMDHGLSLGAIPGLEHPANLLGRLIEAGVDGTLMSAGMAKKLAPVCQQANLSLSITADDQYWGPKPGQPEDIRGVLTACSVERAQAVGGDTYKLIMGWGLPDEVTMQNLTVIARAAEEAFHAGMPLMLEPLWFGPALSSEEHDEVILHAARIAWEYGADILKIPAVGLRTLEKILLWDVPTVFLGGAKTDDQTQLMERIRLGVQAGARGVVVGRNVWQSPDMDAVIEQLRQAIGRGT